MMKLKYLLSFGNTKLPKSTAIFNLGTAHACPSDKLGLCKVSDVCYAKKAENVYKQVSQYRQRQFMYWKNTSSQVFAQEFLDAIKRKKTPVTDLRFNESGDFYGQEDVWKMDRIAMFLSYYGVNTYVYTARSDLDYSKIKHCTIIASGFASKDVDGQFIMSRSAQSDAKEARALGFNAVVCPADCKICSICPDMKRKSYLVFAQKH